MENRFFAQLESCKMTETKTFLYKKINLKKNDSILHKYNFVIRDVFERKHITLLLNREVINL